jgi:hypothetical protein
MEDCMSTVILLRILFSTLILRFPLIGGILAVILDYFDFEYINKIDPGNSIFYQNIDKKLDLNYQLIEAYVTLSWKNQSVKYTALVLLVYRLIGTLGFEITQNKLWLVFFPNVFELFFLLYLASQIVFKRDVFADKFKLIGLLVSLFVIKLIHEYFIHINTTIPWCQNIYLQLILPPTCSI